MSNKYLILIVEDEPNIASFIGTILEASNFETMFARNGAEAIMLITSHTRPWFTGYRRAEHNTKRAQLVKRAYNSRFGPHKGARQGYGP